MKKVGHDMNPDGLIKKGEALPLLFPLRPKKKKKVIVYNKFNKPRVTLPRKNVIKEEFKKIRRSHDHSILFSVSPTGWAYDLRCISLKYYLSKYYDIDKYSNRYMSKHGGGYDLIYIPGFESINKAGARTENRKFCITIGGLVSRTIEYAAAIINIVSAAAVINLAWYNELSKYVDTKKLFYIPNGVRTDLFTPNRVRRASRKFTVAWAGNDRSTRLRVKRIDMLRKVCHNLGIPLLEHNWSHNRIPHSKMPEFYNQVDLYVNCSSTEGSNNPILEACSSGIPVLATEVGNVPELIKSGVVPLQHDLSDLPEKILFFKNMYTKDRDEIGLRLREEMINHYDWSKIAMEYKKMFDFSLRN